MDIIRMDLRIDKESEVKMTSLAERLRMAGRQEGKKEGKLEERIETCKKALLAGAPVEFVVQITGLALEEVIKIKNSL